jgi:GNAT superfamily N-acetyltransferase
VKWEKDEFWITDVKSLADIDFITTALNTTYWAENRAKEIIEKSIANSVLLSLFHGDQQIGFTRIVSDDATFAWICDVYVYPDYRGRGLGVWLMACTMEHPAANVGQVVLATKDAHGLYEKFGFSRREYMFQRR